MAFFEGEGVRRGGGACVGGGVRVVDEGEEMAGGEYKLHTDRDTSVNTRVTSLSTKSHVPLPPPP